MTGYPRSEVRDGMHIDWDVPIEMDDGLVLHADVYRPPTGGDFPAILTYGPYGKWLHFEQLYDEQWNRMCAEHPDVPAGSTNKYQAWETVDPEKWVPDDYAVVRVDSRGAGRSPGHIDPFSARETRDFAACIEWAAAQPWSNGHVGLNGISYYAINQWQVATLDPDGLAAMCVWEGAADFYRDQIYHGGIYTTFAEDWFGRQVETIQHGLGAEGFRSPMTGDPVSGPAELTDEELGANRTDYRNDLRSSPLATDDYWAERAVDWTAVDVPFLSAANWGGHGLHPRGNFEGFVRAESEQKWLEVHGLEHWTHFYTDYGLALQKRFFGHFLKGEDTGWADQPRVLLNIRHPDEVFIERDEEAWPIPRTDWSRYYLEADGLGLHAGAPAEAAAVTYDGLGEGVTFLTEPIAAETELTGPIAAKLFVSSATEDADLFVILRVFGPDVAEVTFQGALDPHTPIAHGWLRASHRKLDEDLSTKWRPYHTHDEVQPLTPGEVYELDIEVWPTSIVVPAGHRLAVSVRGTDYEYPGDIDVDRAWRGFTGVGPFSHDAAEDRPPEVYGGDVTLHTGPEHPSHVLLPIVPARA